MELQVAEDQVPLAATAQEIFLVVAMVVQVIHFLLFHTLSQEKLLLHRTILQVSLIMLEVVEVDFMAALVQQVQEHRDTVVAASDKQVVLLQQLMQLMDLVVVEEEHTQEVEVPVVTV